MMSSLVTRIRFGSHLYGTATPQSDEDWKSVYLPTAEDILLQRVAASTGHVVKRAEGIRNAPGDVDDEAYSLQRYLELLAGGQTVAIDMLFAPDPLVTSSLWNEVRGNKTRLLTKKSAAFVGYCRTQANKYGIKGSRVAAARRAMEFFAEARSTHGERARVLEVASQLPSLCTDEHTKLVSAPVVMQARGSVETKQRSQEFFECCNRKVEFGNTVKAAYEMYKRVFDEYGQRALMAEKGEGVDWKALSHAVRVGTEALELLRSGVVTFPRPDAAWLREIKVGAVTYERVAGEIEVLLSQVEEASRTSSLREEPDWEFIDALVLEVYGERVHHYVEQRRDTQSKEWWATLDGNGP